VTSEQDVQVAMVGVSCGHVTVMTSRPFVGPYARDWHITMVLGKCARCRALSSTCSAARTSRSELCLPVCDAARGLKHPVNPVFDLLRPREPAFGYEQALV
jgi:hypothetical protein